MQTVVPFGGACTQGGVKC